MHFLGVPAASMTGFRLQAILVLLLLLEGVTRIPRCSSLRPLESIAFNASLDPSSNETEQCTKSDVDDSASSRAGEANPALLNILKATSAGDDDSSSSASPSFAGIERDIIELFDKNSPSVANILAVQMPRNNPISKFFDSVPRKVKTSSGSAFMWDDEHLVTAFHILSDEKKKSILPRLVVLVDFMAIHTYVEATVVGADPKNDIAVLRLLNLQGEHSDGIKVYYADGIKLTGRGTKDTDIIPKPLPQGKSISLKVGQRVVSLGNRSGGGRGVSLKMGTLSEMHTLYRTSNPAQPQLNSCVLFDGK